jgi:DNA-binding transcriptional MerR regulator
MKRKMDENRRIGQTGRLPGRDSALLRTRGLLHTAVRDEANNYRRYEHSHLERLTFIRRCRALDMTHGEIRALLQARTEPDASCESINELIDAHLQHVLARMAELAALEAQLTELRSQCHAAQATRDAASFENLINPTSPTGVVLLSCQVMWLVVIA